MNKLKKMDFLVPILLVLAVVFGPIIIKQNTLLFYGDSIEQMYQFYVGGWDKVHSGTLTLWNWSNVFGASSFCDVYYYLTSPFFWIACLFPKQMMATLFLYLNILKLLLAYIFSYNWLFHIFGKKHLSIIGALATTFSGWVGFLFHYNLFLDTYFIYFIILYFLDNYLEYDKSKYAMVVAVGVLCVINYYNAYMFLPFMMIYALLRICMIDEFSVANIVKKLISLFLWILLGVGLSCIVLIPCAEIIIQTSRISSDTTPLFSPVSAKIIFRYISSLFAPVADRYNSNVFIGYASGNGIGWNGGVSLYAFVLTPLLMVLLPFIKDKKKRNTLLFGVALFSVMILFPVFYKLLQGTVETRWFYMIILFNVFSSLHVLDEIEEKKIDSKYIIISGISIVLLIGALVFVSHYKWLSFNFSLLYKVELALVILTLIYSFSIYKHYLKLLMVAVIIEAMIPFGLLLNYGDYMTNSFIDYETMEASDLFHYIDDYEYCFYRIYMSKFAYEYKENSAAYNNFYGTTGYSSIYNYQQEDFLQHLKANWKIGVNVGRTNIYSLASVKYWVTNNHNNDIVPFGYHYAYSFANYDIYTNDYFIGLGFASTSTLNANAIENEGFINQERLMLNYIITEDSENTEYEYLNTLIPLVEGEYTNYIELDETNTENGYNLYIQNYNTEEMIVELYYQGELVLSKDIFQYNYIDLYFEPEIIFDKIVIRPGDAYLTNPYLNVYKETDFDYYDEWYAHLNRFYNILDEKTRITAQIDISENKSTVYTSIPYDSGWHVKVNGKEVETKKVNYGFIGFELDEGNYEVEFTYWPKSLTLGMLVSLGSLLLLIMLILRGKKHEKG